MTVKPIPDGYHTVTPYLVVPGVAGLIEFLKQAFGAQETHRTVRPDGNVMHAQVQIGSSPVMMGEPMGDQPPIPAALYLYFKDTDTVYRRAIEAGGESVMEPADQFYGDRNAGVKDPSGNLWWIATRKEDLTAEEIEKRAQAL